MMIKRLALICCILLLPTIAAAEGNTDYGDFWVGGQIGGVFTLDRNLTVTGPGFEFQNSISTPAAFSAGAIVGYNFWELFKQPWERYSRARAFGVALDFQWNQFNQSIGSGNQFALAFLARAQLPAMIDETFTLGRLVPFIMAGPAIVWTNSAFKDSTNAGVVAEIGLEYFINPQLSLGPSFRYRHVFGGDNYFQNVKIDEQLDQFMILARLGYHF
jgi:opacity protein-like surface antigen